MPIYEYLCRRCRESVDVLQRLSDPPIKKCPKCGAKSLKRQISLPTVHIRSRSNPASVLAPEMGFAVDGTGGTAHWPEGAFGVRFEKATQNTPA